MTAELQRLFTFPARPKTNVRKRERDTQKEKVYRSDPALAPYAEPLTTVQDVERFIKYVWSLKRVRDAFPKAFAGGWKMPGVKDGRGRRMAYGNASVICLPMWARKSDVALHELAHTITCREFDRYVAAHGWQYASVYLKLALYVMGRKAHDDLKVAFKKNRVRFAPKKTRAPLSPERRAELVERMAACRAARTPKVKSVYQMFPRKLDL